MAADEPDVLVLRLLQSGEWPGDVACHNCKLLRGTKADGVEPSPGCRIGTAGGYHMGYEPDGSIKGLGGAEGRGVVGDNEGKRLER
jgi:hypothetical protein